MGFSWKKQWHDDFQYVDEAATLIQIGRPDLAYRCLMMGFRGWLPGFDPYDGPHMDIRALVKKWEDA